MPSSRLLLLLLLLVSPPPPQPYSLAPPDTPAGKATIMGLILSALERATSFLKKRLPEINLDGVVGFRVLEGGCTLVPLDGPPEKQFSASYLPALLGGLLVLEPSWDPAVLNYFRSKKDSDTTWEKIWKLFFSWEEMIYLRGMVLICHEQDGQRVYALSRGLNESVAMEKPETLKIRQQCTPSTSSQSHLKAPR